MIETKAKIEGVKGPIDAVRLRIHPVPTSRIELPYRQTPRVVIDEVLQLFDLQRAGSMSPLELRNYFGKWQQVEDESVRKYLADHLETVYTNNMRKDASRGITGMTVTLYDGLPSRRLFGYELAPFEWVMGLSTSESLGMGDGTASYSRQEGWSVTQQKGQYSYNSDVLIRQLR